MGCNTSSTVPNVPPSPAPLTNEADRGSLARPKTGADVDAEPLLLDGDGAVDESQEEEDGRDESGVENGGEEDRESAPQGDSPGGEDGAADRSANENAAEGNEAGADEAQPTIQDDPMGTDETRGDQDSVDDNGEEGGTTQKGPVGAESERGGEAADADGEPMQGQEDVNLSEDEKGEAEAGEEKKEAITQEQKSMMHEALMDVIVAKNSGASFDEEFPLAEDEAVMSVMAINEALAKMEMDMKPRHLLAERYPSQRSAPIIFERPTVDKQQKQALQASISRMQDVGNTESNAFQDCGPIGSLEVGRLFDRGGASTIAFFNVMNRLHVSFQDFSQVENTMKKLADGTKGLRDRLWVAINTGLPATVSTSRIGQSPFVYGVWASPEEVQTMCDRVLESPVYGLLQGPVDDKSSGVDGAESEIKSVSMYVGGVPSIAALLIEEEELGRHFSEVTRAGISLRTMNHLQCYLEEASGRDSMRRDLLGILIGSIETLDSRMGDLPQQNDDATSVRAPEVYLTIAGKQGSPSSLLAPKCKVSRNEVDVLLQHLPRQVFGPWGTQLIDVRYVLTAWRKSASQLSVSTKSRVTNRYLTVEEMAQAMELFFLQAVHSYQKRMINRYCKHIAKIECPMVDTKGYVELQSEAMTAEQMEVLAEKYFPVSDFCGVIPPFPFSLYEVPLVPGARYFVPRELRAPLLSNRLYPRLRSQRLVDDDEEGAVVSEELKALHLKLAVEERLLLTPNSELAQEHWRSEVRLMDRENQMALSNAPTEDDAVGVRDVMGKDWDESGPISLKDLPLSTQDYAEFLLRKWVLVEFSARGIPAVGGDFYKTIPFLEVLRKGPTHPSIILPSVAARGSSRRPRTDRRSQAFQRGRETNALTGARDLRSEGWQLFARTTVCEDDSTNAHWPAIALNIDALCGGDMLRPIMIRLCALDKRRVRQPVLLGTVTTTVADLLTVQGQYKGLVLKPPADEDRRRNETSVAVQLTSVGGAQVSGSSGHAGVIFVRSARVCHNVTLGALRSPFSTLFAPNVVDEMAEDIKRSRQGAAMSTFKVLLTLEAVDLPINPDRPQQAVDSYVRVYTLQSMGRFATWSLIQESNVCYGARNATYLPLILNGSTVANSLDRPLRFDVFRSRPSQYADVLIGSMQTTIRVLLARTGRRFYLTQHTLRPSTALARQGIDWWYNPTALARGLSTVRLPALIDEKSAGTIEEQAVINLRSSVMERSSLVGWEKAKKWHRPASDPVTKLIYDDYHQYNFSVALNRIPHMKPQLYLVVAAQRYGRWIPIFVTRSVSIVANGGGQEGGRLLFPPVVIHNDEFVSRPLEEGKRIKWSNFEVRLTLYSNIRSDEMLDSLRTEFHNEKKSAGDKEAGKVDLSESGGIQDGKSFAWVNAMDREIASVTVTADQLLKTEQSSWDLFEGRSVMGTITSTGPVDPDPKVAQKAFDAASGYKSESATSTGRVSLGSRVVLNCGGGQGLASGGLGALVPRAAEVLVDGDLLDFFLETEHNSGQPAQGASLKTWTGEAVSSSFSAFNLVRDGARAAFLDFLAHGQRLNISKEGWEAVERFSTKTTHRR